MTPSEKRQALKLLVVNGQIDVALEYLLQLSLHNSDQNTVLNLLGQYNRYKTQSTSGLLTNEQSNITYARLTSAVNATIDDVEDTVIQEGPAIAKQQSTPPSSPNPPTSRAVENQKVFISYNHKDKDIAHRLRDRLNTEEGIDVIIDVDDMRPGEDIKTFIMNCIRKSDVTLSVVSPKSLLSAWVAMESIQTMNDEQLNQKRLFIPCYIDDSFFSRNFVDDALDTVDAEIEDIQSSMQRRLEKGRAVGSLQTELKRYKDLSHHLDEIVGRLQNSLCLDIRAEAFEGSVQRIIAELSTSNS